MYLWGHQIISPWGWGWGLFEALISIVIVIILVRIILHIVRGGSYHHRHHHHWEDWNTEAEDKSSSIRILDERYAKGDISDEEYRTKKANLK